LRTIIEELLRTSRGLTANFVIGSAQAYEPSSNFAGKSAVIVVQAATPGNEKRIEVLMQFEAGSSEFKL
jgi:hypothetical protein